MVLQNYISVSKLGRKKVKLPLSADGKILYKNSTKNQLLEITNDFNKVTE